jgi:hypothetical protein
MAPAPTISRVKGSHLQQAQHSDAHRLTRHVPKTISATYKIDVHPADSAGSRNGVCDQVLYVLGLHGRLVIQGREADLAQLRRASSTSPVFAPFVRWTA